jgi:hypothetical protein
MAAEFCTMEIRSGQKPGLDYQFSGNRTIRLPLVHEGPAHAATLGLAATVTRALTDLSTEPRLKGLPGDEDAIRLAGVLGSLFRSRKRLFKYHIDVKVREASLKAGNGFLQALPSLVTRFTGRSILTGTPVPFHNKILCHLDNGTAVFLHLPALGATSRQECKCQSNRQYPLRHLRLLGEVRFRSLY